ncbi:MAG: hypothetical protein ACRC1K_21310, partial [Planctomycetia bacterium]
MQRTADFLIHRRVPLFVAGLVVTAFLYPATWYVKFDRSVASLFPPGHPQLVAYQRAAADFGGDSTLLAVYTDPDLLTAAGMKRLNNLASTLGDVPGVTKATCLADLPRPGVVALAKPLLSWFEDAERPPAAVAPGLFDGFFGNAAVAAPLASATTLDQLRGEILDSPLYTDIFLGTDGQTTAVVLMIDRQAMADGRFEASVAKMRGL